MTKTRLYYVWCWLQVLTENYLFFFPPWSKISCSLNRTDFRALSKVLSSEKYIFRNVLARRLWHLPLFQPKRLQPFSRICQLQPWNRLINQKSHFWSVRHWLRPPSASALVCLFHSRHAFALSWKFLSSQHNASLHDCSDLVASVLGINCSWVHIKYLMEEHRDLSASVSGKINQAEFEWYGF